MLVMSEIIVQISELRICYCHGQLMLLLLVFRAFSQNANLHKNKYVLWDSLKAVLNRSDPVMH